MSDRNKIVAGVVLIASAALFLGYATFDQWSGFVSRLLVGLA